MVFRQKLLAIRIESYKRNFTCIQYGGKKNVLKHYQNTALDYYSLLTTLSKSSMHSLFNIAVVL